MRAEPTSDEQTMPPEAVHGGDFHSPALVDSERESNTDLQVLAPVPNELHAILSPEALTFLGGLSRRFSHRRHELLQQRPAFRTGLRAGRRPGFLPESRSIRDSDWSVLSPPPDLKDRRVEITGPVDRKMVINALNSGASAYMADFEDSHSPTWTGTLQGQANLRDAVRETLTYRSPEGREYRLARSRATLMVRPRGWHLDERHFHVDGDPISASLFDFGLFAFHNGAELLRRGSGPYFYLPKLEHHEEAALWNEVFEYSEARLGLPRNSIRATVLIETLPAVFEMEEILFALRPRILGLNGGRWDYLFSFIKEFRDDPSLLIPERSQLPMTTPFLDAYSRLIVDTCHRRGAYAIGGMAAQIPVRQDPTVSEAAIASVVADKEREVRLGYDGTWVAHPGLVAPVRDVFDRAMAGPNQLKTRTELPPAFPDCLLELPGGTVSPLGFQSNVRVALRYLEAWFQGVGCVPIDHLMEDAATVEITRSQLWHWVQRGALLSDGRPASVGLFRTEVANASSALRQERGLSESRHRALELAGDLLERLVTEPEFTEFFTLPAYEMLIREGG